MGARVTLDITGHDLFCGAGGSTTGFIAAGGVMLVAANHDALAIETHNTNHPSVDHRLTDISQSDPRSFPHADVLIASPECTNQTGAKAHKTRIHLWNRDDPKAQARFAAEERSRATMWDVVRFAEFHRYQVGIIENVLEARKWDLFEPWLLAMHALGYEHRAVYLNSMIAFPTPQSRDRMYVVFWRRGNPAPDLEIRPKAWCAVHGDVEAIQTWKNPLRPWGKYRSQYVYRCPACSAIALPYAWPAASAIDWSLIAPRIGDRQRPLAPATVRRILAGLARYGGAAIVQGAGHTYERAGYYRTWPLWEPLGTQMGTALHGLVVDTAYSGRDDASKVRAVDDPLATQTGRQSASLVTLRGTDAGQIEGSTRPVEDPIGTVSAGGIHHGLLVRGFGEQGGDPGRMVRTTSDPFGALTAHDTTKLLIRQYSGGAEMARPVDAPTGTVTGVDHHALLVDYHGAGKPGRSVDEPHRTMDSRDRYGLVEAGTEIDDCGFRMLEPYEIKRAMAFPDEYVILGTKRQQVKQAGNAVTPPAMNLLVGRSVFGTLG